MPDPAPRLQLLRPGLSPLDLSSFYSGLKWASAAVGGYANCSFNLTGDWRLKVPKLSIVQVTYGPVVLFEGQVEDTKLTIGSDTVTTAVEAFGLRRRLEQTSVRRIYMKRDLNWTLATAARGAQLFPGGSVSVAQVDNGGDQLWTAGQFDTSDLTKIGLQMIRSDDTTVYAAGEGRVAELLLSGATATAILGTVHIRRLGAGNGVGAVGGSSNGGTTWASSMIVAQPGGASDTTTDFTLTCAPGADRIRIGVAASPGPGNPDANADYTSLRVLGATTTEDASGGLYGGTILRDLISLVPDLTAGIIENGEDFTIEQLDRSVRDTGLSIVEEVSGYHFSREWGVWEGGRFDWRSTNFDEPEWIVPVEDLVGCEIASTIDNLLKTIYLSFVDAVTFEAKEASATSTDQRNPFVKSGQVKDASIQVPYLMTTNTAQRLADVLARLQGGYPPVSGTVKILETTLVSRLNGPPMPAFMIRGGDNIAINGLPKTDPFQQGRDGETLFHIASAEHDMDSGIVEIAVEGQDRRSDVLMARLAAATRSVSG